MLYNIVLASAIHQHESATGLLSPEPSSHLPPHPTPPGCHRTLGELSVSRSKFPLALSFIGFPLAWLVKNPLAMRETWVQSLRWEDSLEKGKAAYSSILAWVW